MLTVKSNCRHAWATWAALALGIVCTGWAYDLERKNGQPITWNAGNVAMRLQFSNGPTLSDGLTYTSTVQTAMDIWNYQIAAVQFTSTTGTPAVPADKNGVSEIGFDSTVYGTAFDANVLAVTVSYFNTTPRPSDGTYARSQSDIIFNQKYNWDSYRGPLRGNEEMQRVALHELGHVLGLDHPDQATPPQSVNALMNSRVGNLDSLAADDINGAQFLYGIAEHPPTILGQPAGLMIYAGQTAQFSVLAAGYPLPTYRWQRLAGGTGTWTDLTDGGNYAGTATNVLTLTSATVAMNADQYRCVAVNSKGNATSNAATLTVQAASAPVFSTQPTSQTVPYVSPATFNAMATGGPAPTYQWQRLAAGTGTWTNLSESIAYAGTTTATFTVNAPTLAMSGDQFRCIATNLVASATSTAATLTVSATAPTISSGPTPRTVSVGQGTTFSVTASGIPNPSYQWQRQATGGVTWSNLDETANYSGVATNTLTLSGILTYMNGDQFRCIVSNVAGTATSQAALLTVSPASPPTITAVSADLYVNAGDVLNVDPGTIVDPLPVTFQWYKDGAIVSGATAAIYTKNQTTVADSGVYTLVVTNSGNMTSSTSRRVTVSVPSNDGVVAAAAGTWHSLFLKSDGSLLAMGKNAEGQLGDGSASSRPSPVQVATGVVSIAAGGSHSLFVKSDGSLWAMGSNLHGQLGDGTTTNRLNAVPVATGVVAAAGGATHSVFLKADGTLWAMGENDLGQLGDGTTTDRSLPVQIATGVVAFEASYAQTYYVKADGTLWAAGYNQNANLGLGTRSYFESVPVQVTTGVRLAGGGAGFALILKQNGGLFGAGPNGFGEIGPTASESPLLIVSGVSDASAGGAHTLFIKTDRTLWGMGYNWYGQLGTGVSLTYELSAVQIATNVAAAVAGDVHSLYAKSDGTLWAMGDNEYGQLGDLTTTSRLSPVTVASGAISAPKTPGGLNASHGIVSEGVLLNWTPTVGATSYEVWRNIANSQSTATRLVSNVPNSLFFDLTANQGVRYYYWVKAVNPAGSALSTSVSHILDAATSRPVITVQPQSQTAPPGSSITFTATATGTPNPTVQWQKNGATISGATSSTYTIANATQANAGTYTFVATNSAGTATSSAATLVINKIAAPVSLVTPTVPYTGSPKAATATTTPAGLAVSLTYNGSPFAPSDAGTYTVVATIADNSYTGTATQTMVITKVNPTITWNPQTTLANGTVLSSAQLNATANVPGSYAYTPAAGTVLTAAGARTLSLVFSPSDAINYTTSSATIGITVQAANSPPVFIIQPVAQSTGVGGSISLSATAVASPAASYQWRKNGQILPGATGSVLNLTNAQLPDAGTYSVVASNSAGTATSDTAVVSVFKDVRADFNNDGKPDLIWSNSNTGERALWLMNGTTFLGASTLGIFPLEWTIAATGDFNSDGKPDIVWSNSQTGERALWLMNGTNLLGVSTLGVFPPEWTVAATADFNVDGKPDLIWSNSLTGERAIWLMSGTNFLSSSTLGIFPLEWTVAATADFNADGKPDLVWSNSLTGERALWLMDGTTRIGVSTLGLFPLEWTVAGTADFNADGKPDIIWSNSVTGERALWLMNGTQFLGASTLGLFPLEWTVSN